MKSFQDLLSEFQSLLEGCYDSSARKLLFASAQHWNVPFRPLSRSKCWKEDRQKDNKLVKSSLAQYIGFYVLFYIASIAIGSDEMTGGKVLLSPFR